MTTVKISPGGIVTWFLHPRLPFFAFSSTGLAHLTPGEAMLLHLATDGGSLNPDTGLLEFWEGEDKKEGTYIWRTVGDSKVRDAHAEREGKVFSWDDPPEGGHPGEAPNCRCWAEDVGTGKCERLKAQMEADAANAEAASDRLSKANDYYNEIEGKLRHKIAELDDAMKKTAVESAPLVRPIKRLLKGQSIDPSDFAGPIPGLLDIRGLKREVEELQMEYDQALADRDFKEKEMNGFKAAYRDSYAEYRSLGCKQ